MKPKDAHSRRQNGERGQAAVFLVLALGFFLIGGVGLAVDGGNLWFHRQTAQTAADAACNAGVMDMLSIAVGANLPNTAPTSSATSYAQLNGYSSGVSFLHPDTFSALDSKPCDYSNTNSICDPHENNLAFPPYLQVNVTDPVPTTFMRFLGANPTVNVPARSTCGLSNVLSSVPVLVLNPNAPNPTSSPAFVVNAGASLAVLGGLQNSIQVNSIDPNDSTGQSAANLSSANIDLSGANGGNGGNLSIAARESQATANGDGINFGTSGRWLSASGVMSDPFANIHIDKRGLKAQAQALGTDRVTYKTTGCNGFSGPPTQPCCPGLSASIACDDYRPGYYPSLTSLGVPCAASPLSGDAAICIGTGPGYPSQAGLAVFEPGIYYLEEDLFAGANSCLRSAATDSSGNVGIAGTMFYLAGPAVLNVTAASSGSCAGTAISVSEATCPGGNLNLPPSVTGFSGNVLLAPCTGPYGDPSGAGKARGMLFFQERDIQPVNQATWSGSSSSSFALVGNLYLHTCVLDQSGDRGANCDPSAFRETLNLGGGSSTAPGYIVGNIVADQLAISPGAHINVVLSPDRQYYVLKASLLQ